LIAPLKIAVIPGQREAMNPEPMNSTL